MGWLMVRGKGKTLQIENQDKLTICLNKGSNWRFILISREWVWIHVSRTFAIDFTTWDASKGEGRERKRTTIIACWLFTQQLNPVPLSLSLSVFPAKGGRVFSFLCVLSQRLANCFFFFLHREKERKKHCYYSFCLSFQNF